MSNSTNHTGYPNITNTNAWKESGAMVYVALTVTIMSSVIMCCVWFVKRRVYKNGYGTVDMQEEDRVELTASGVSDEDVEGSAAEPAYTDNEEEAVAVGEEEVNSTDGVAAAFVLEDNDSSEEEIDLHAEHVEAV